MAYPAPAASERDFLVLQLLNGLLTRGKSARLQRALVYGADPVATRLGASLPMMREPYLYSLEAQLVPGRSNREAERRIDAALADLAAQPPRPEEVAKAVNGMRGDAVRAALDTQGRADLVGFSVLATDDPTTLFRRLDEAGQVTPEEVRAAAQRYLQPHRRAVVTCVSPDRLQALLQDWAAAGGETAELSRKCFAWADERHAANERRGALEEEQQAIELLDARLARQEALLEADESATAGDRLQALRTFRAEGGKGVAVRRAAAAQAAEALQTQEQGLDRTRASLAERLAAAAADSGEGSPHGVQVELARAALELGPPPTVDSLQAWEPGEAAAPLLLALARLAHRRRELATADAAACAVLAIEQETPTPSALLSNLADLAWECRCSEAPRAPTQQAEVTCT